MKASARIAKMPKVEQHLHLEGAIRPETARSLALRQGVTPPGAAEQFSDFAGFLRAFLAGLDLLNTAQDFADITDALARELAAQNVIYAEVTTTPFNHHRRGVSMEEYASGLGEGRIRAAAHGVDIGWIFDIPRELEPPAEEFTSDFILGPLCPEGVVGIGLGGPEIGWPAERFASSFARVVAAGLAALPHAGETEGARSIWAAIETLGAARIGHGIRAVDDPELVDYLAAHRLPLEISMTSNVCTGVVASIAEHPIRRLADAGVVVTVNTDDPAYFFTDLTAELIAAHESHHFTLDELAAIQSAAIATSYASDDVTERFAAAMDFWRQDSESST